MPLEGFTDCLQYHCQAYFPFFQCCLHKPFIFLPGQIPAFRHKCLFLYPVCPHPKVIPPQVFKQPVCCHKKRINACQLILFLLPEILLISHHQLLCNLFTSCICCKFPKVTHIFFYSCF